jgi:hypothetical protein
MKIYPQRHTRTEVRDSKNKLLATLTDGAYTVTLAGPVRTFAEPTAAHSVTHSVWVRTLPAPFDGNVDMTWLTRALKANKKAVPDVHAIAMQYIAGELILDGRIIRAVIPLRCVIFERVGCVSEDE